MNMKSSRRMAVRQILTALLAALASWPAIATELVETANALPLDAAVSHNILDSKRCSCNAWNSLGIIATPDGP